MSLPPENAQPPKPPLRPGPGMHVQPGLPLSVNVGKLPDGSILIHFEHATGSTMLPVPRSFVESMIAQLQDAIGGIVVPPSSPVFPLK